MKYSKALVVLSFMLVGIFSTHLTRDWTARRWDWLAMEALCGLGFTVTGLYNLSNLKRKDQ